jgi:hypothetical protein
MREQEKWAPWGALAGALVGITITTVAALSGAPLSANVLVVGIVGLTPALAALGVVLAIDARLLLAPWRAAFTPRLTAEVERTARERFRPRPGPDGIQGKA